jgi:hypothetical protein
MSATTTEPTGHGPQEARIRHPRVSLDRSHLSDPRYQAYLLLRVAFVAAPILFGVDKFFNWMTFWPKYLWVGFPHLFGVSPQQFMYSVGVVEITAGLLTLLLPRIAPYVVAGWLGGIIANSIILSASIGGHTAVSWDIALRDFGLMIAALALGRLAAAYAPQRWLDRRLAALIHSHRS